VISEINEKLVLYIFIIYNDRRINKFSKDYRVESVKENVRENDTKNGMAKE
jgi:hypothetical protein